MHPINFYLRGAINADYPGEASRYIERFHKGRTVAEEATYVCIGHAKGFGEVSVDRKFERVKVK